MKPIPGLTRTVSLGALRPPDVDDVSEALSACLARPGLRANDVSDAHLAALAVERGLRLATSDSGFARFSGLEWFDPLQPA